MSIQSKKKLRDSGILFALMLIVIFSLLPYLLHGKFSFLSIYLAGIIFFISIFSPFSLRRPLEYWIKIGNLLGKLNSNLILGIFFYLILVPSSIIRYLIKFFTTNHKIKYKSYYIRKSQDDISKLKDQY